MKPCFITLNHRCLPQKGQDEGPHEPGGGAAAPDLQRVRLGLVSLAAGHRSTVLAQRGLHPQEEFLQQRQQLSHHASVPYSVFIGQH